MADNKPKTVRLDSEVMEELAKKRNGFETPNDCIKRLLGKNPCTQAMTTIEEDDEENEQEKRN